MNGDEELPISVGLSMCVAKRGRDSSGCRASGVTPELPVHLVLVPPLFHLRGATSTASSLLFHGLPSEVSCSPAVVVSK